MKTSNVSSLFHKKRVVPYIFMAPSLVLFITVFIYPIGFVLWTSMFKWNFLRPQDGKTFVGLDNFINLLTSNMFWDSLWITVKFVLLSVPIELFLGLCLALLLNRPYRGKKIIQLMMLVPLMVAPIAAYISWKFIFDPTYGVLNYLISLAGFKGFGWLSSVDMALFSVAIIDWWLFTPFVFLILYAALQAVPQDPIEAAKIDGANRFQIFWYVTFPSIMPVFLVVTIIRIMDAIRVFDNIYVLTEGGPAGATSTIQYLNYEMAFTSLTIGRASAMAILIVIFIILVGFILIRQMNQTNEKLIK